MDPAGQLYDGGHRGASAIQPRRDSVVWGRSGGGVPSTFVGNSEHWRGFAASGFVRAVRKPRTRPSYCLLKLPEHARRWTQLSGRPDDRIEQEADRCSQTHAQAVGVLRSRRSGSGCRPSGIRPQQCEAAADGPPNKGTGSGARLGRGEGRGGGHSGDRQIESGQAVPTGARDEPAQLRSDGLGRLRRSSQDQGIPAGE